MALPYLREDQALITLGIEDSSGTLQNIPTGSDQANGFAFYGVEGGALSAAGSKSRSGAMGRQVAVGGPATRSTITLTTQQRDEILAKHSFLEGRVGKGAAVVSIIFLDSEGNVRTGSFAGSATNPIQLTGVVMEASRGAQQTESPTVVMYTITIDADE